MNVDLSKTGFYLNDLLIERNLTKISEAVAALEENPREIDLDYGIRLFVFDDLGVRMWAKGTLVSQVQIVLNEEKPDEKFPREFYRGSVTINENKISYPIYRSEIERLGELLPDDDSQRFGVNMFKLKLDDYEFAFWLDKNQEQVNSFYS